MSFREKANRAKKLEPGEKLRWSRPPKGRRQTEGGYGIDMFGQEHGDPVTFVKYREASTKSLDYEEIGGKQIDLDQSGFPLIQVQTLQGTLDLSAIWFDWST